MTAPESVVRAVMDAESCLVEWARVWDDALTHMSLRPYCRTHKIVAPGGTCPTARSHADAAFAASLEWAAEQVEHPNPCPASVQCEPCATGHLLRRWARGER